MLQNRRQMTGTDPKPASSPRRFPRYPIDLRVSLQVFRAGEILSLWGRSNEIGADGIGATLTRQLEPGEVVSMAFTFPTPAHLMKLRALVRYRDGLRHGFEFLALSAEQREGIARMCEILAAST
jgi:PilZ domain